jgi:lipid A 3-O-deacylase
MKNYHKSRIFTVTPNLPPGWALLAVLCISAVFSKCCGADDVVPIGYFRFQLENDRGYSDRYYTNGIRLENMTLGESVPDWIKTTANFLHQDIETRDLGGWYLGQLMFTPTDVRLSDPPLTERPYNGWLYFGIQRMRFSEHRRDTRAISVGFTGDWSGAEQAQKIIHAIGRKIEKDGYAPPKGWHTQPAAEPAVDLFVEERGKYDLLTCDCLGLQVLPYASANVGTVLMTGRAGATVRIGTNLPSDFGHAVLPMKFPLSTEPKGRDPESSTPPLRSRKWGLHGFATLDGKGVLYSASLDGALFHDSRSVDKKPWVYDAIWGWSLTSPCWYLTYSHVTRSKEFNTQTSVQQFHSVSVTLLH